MLKKPVECGFRKIGLDKVMEELVIAKHKLDEEGVEFFVVYGLLLGMIRDKKLIINDKDFDFGVMGDSVLFELRKKWQGKYYRDVSIDSTQSQIKNANKLWFKKDIGDICIPMELQAYYIKGEYVYHNHDLGETWPFRYGRLVYPKRLFESFAKVEFAGEIWNVPNPPEEFLDAFYGKDWRTPKAYIDWRYHCGNIYRGMWE